MIKIEALTLEEAYKNAADSLECSVTELKIEVVQSPSNGFLGLFKKSAIIVAVKEVNSKSLKKEDTVVAEKKPDTTEKKERTEKKVVKPKEEPKKEKFAESKPQEKKQETNKKTPKKQTKKRVVSEKKEKTHNMLNDTIMPTSFVSTQDDEDEYDDDVTSYLADYDDEEDATNDLKNISEIAKDVENDVNNLFDLTCFKIDKIIVSVYDENTLLLEFKGEDAALLIGKEGYRYKALSYMLFNWINTKYQIQLRLEIAEFLKNQEESISKYLVGVCENIQKDGRAQTKILDGVLIQIALKELRDRYPDKYIVIRSTRDGLKYIIVNDYHSN